MQKKIEKIREEGNISFFKDSNGGEYIFEFNDNGKPIYIKNPNKEEYFEYDELERLIHYKNNTNGREIWRDYDEEGNLCHIVNSEGFEAWYKGDDNYTIHINTKNSKEIHTFENGIKSINCIFKDGTETLNVYNKEGNITYHKDSSGIEYWKEYDRSDNLIHYMESKDGTPIHEEYFKYNEEGNMSDMAYDDINVNIRYEEE